MSLMQTIRDKQLSARKAGIPEAALYTTLLGEASIIGKNAGNRETTDAEVVAVVKKFIKNIDDTLGYLGNSIEDALTDRRELLVAERKCLEELLPSQIAGERLQQVIGSIVNEIGATSPKDMGRVMALLKERFDGQYDGKSASLLVKEALS